MIGIPTATGAMMDKSRCPFSITTGDVIFRANRRRDVVEVGTVYR